MSVTVTVDGSEIRRLVESLPRQLQRKYLGRGLRAGAKVVRDAARVAIPRRTGALARAIRVRAGKRRRKDAVGINVVIGRQFFAGPTFYGAFLEFGFKRGKRGSTNRKAVPARHYLERSAERSAAQAMRAVSESIRSDLEAVRKGAAK